ncbi:MAG: SRPBCC family protein [Verrucomicrobiota bacterium]
MKIAISILAILFSIALLVLVVGLILPRDYRVERELTINATPEQLFPYINDPSQRKVWSPFQGPQTETSFEGPTEGLGARMNWNSPGSSGHIIIQKSDPPSSVTYDTHFDNGYPTSTSEFRFEPTENGKATRVVWDFWGKVPVHPLKRYYVLRIDESTGGKHLKGLENLKAVVEGTPPQS